MQDQYVEMNIKDITGDTTYRYRANLDIGELADSIKRDGQLIPIVVRRQGDKYQLISGFRRIAAMTKLGRKRVQAKVIDVASDAQARRISLLENLERNSLSAWDLAATAAKFRKQGMKNAEIAEAFRASTRTIQRYLFVAKAPDDYRAALQRDDITIQQAYEGLKKGVPCSELLQHGRSVRYLRRLSTSSRAGARKDTIKIQRKTGGEILIQIRYKPNQTNLNRIFENVRDRLKLLKL